MIRLEIPLTNVDSEYLSQIRYSLSFAAEEIISYEILNDEVIVVDIADEKNADEIKKKVETLLARYSQHEYGFKRVVHFEQSRDLPSVDAWRELVRRKWAKSVGSGHVVLRGPAAQILHLIDRKVEREFGGRFDAEYEHYPSTIQATTLDRTNHFTSFPEHVDFVSHLKSDVDVLGEFANKCKENGWSSEFHKGRMAGVEFAIAPACCYHAYEAMEGWELDLPGRCITSSLHCHRYEGRNMTTLSRLGAFTMRELVWIGHPKFVTESRKAAIEPLLEWVKAWDLDCVLENANDMFFTDDFSVKASFQRQQEGKLELKFRIPHENTAIACTSSNFHQTTFGKAFDIKVNRRPAASACMAWGLERWVYAIFSQYGFDFSKWPEAPKEEFLKAYGEGWE